MKRLTPLVKCYLSRVFVSNARCSPQKDRDHPLCHHERPVCCLQGVGRDSTVGLTPLCTGSSKYLVPLDPNKMERALPDGNAAWDGDLLVIDGSGEWDGDLLVIDRSGEDGLYPADWGVPALWQSDPHLEFGATE